MKTRIQVIGVGQHGCRLLDEMMACGLRQELADDTSPSIAEIRYSAIETNIATLSCSGADQGFYLGGSMENDGEPAARDNLAAQTAQIMEHVIHGAHLILVLTALDDPLECVAAASLAELGKARGILVVSLVSLPPGGPPSSDRAAADLAHIRASSDALYAFASDEQVTSRGPSSKPINTLIHCANGLAKFLCQPHGRRVGFDFQDFRTGLLGWGEPRHANPDQLVQFRHHYLRWVASLHTPPAELAAVAMESLPLGNAATVMMYIEGGPGFSMSRLRDLVMPITTKAPKSAFIKYFVEVDPGMPEDALTIDLYVRTDLEITA